MLPRRAPGLRRELVRVADHAIDLGHGGKCFGLGLRRATGDDDARLRPLPPHLADRLPRLAHRLGGDRAGVDHNGVRQPGRGRRAADHFRFGGVEPAAEGQDIDAHDRSCNRSSVLRPGEMEMKPTLRRPWSLF